jgi:5S rRNA maturation endonuclease (ribonuclease M5)
MKKGLFFETYFTERGESYYSNSDGEIGVRCPFEHDKGFESNPSAFVNEDKGLFVCFTCQTEGRESGFSEVSFAAKVLNIKYTEALKLLEHSDAIDGHMFQQWDKAIENLQQNKSLLQYLLSRGITPAVAREYRLGFTGGGIMYPITVFDTLVDIREYRPNEKPKMKSRMGTNVSLFPFDVWRRDTRPTILCAGENDALLLRKMGFNAVTTTGGEGQFPQVFVSYFKGRDVYVCYDCDNAGTKGARKVSHILREAGVKPKIISLGLAGTPESKDVTDYFTKEFKAIDDFINCMRQAVEYTDDMYTEDKNKIYPLINLWHVGNSAFENRRLSSRVLYAGGYDMDMRVPDVVKWECHQDEIEEKLPKVCKDCPLRECHGMWSLDDKNLKDLLHIVEQDDAKVMGAIRSRFIGFPKDCPKGSAKVVSRIKVKKVVFNPDVATEQDVDGFQATEQTAYVLGDVAMQEGARYRTYFRSCAHPLQGNRVYMVVDRAEDSDNALNSFRMNPSINEQLTKAFRLETVEASMRDRALRMKGIIDEPYMNPHPMITHAFDLTMHSALSFNFNKSPIDKGYPELLIVGESGTGKSEAPTKFIHYVGIGNITVLKDAGRASLLGGSEKAPNGAHKVKWGTVPRNHRGFLAMDELGGMDKGVFSMLTDMRSSGIARLEKMGVGGGQAPAKTRLLWLSNPRSEDGRERPISAYAYGTDIVRELVGKDEDIRRFDAVLIVTKDEVMKNGWMESLDYTPHDREAYRNLIFWVWSRKPEQIVWEEGVETFIKNVADKFNELYDTHIKLFGLDAWKKIARLAVACAGATYSASEDGECIVVTREHVNFVSKFLTDCYINPTFKLDRFVRHHRQYENTNDEINAIVAKMIKVNRSAILALIESPNGYCSFKQLEYAAKDMETNSLKSLISNMVEHKLVKLSSVSIIPTQRLQKAIDHYREHHEDYEISPLYREGEPGL